MARQVPSRLRRPPAAPRVGAALLVGFLGYGVSLVLFVLALRSLGTARTGAYFSLAPFVGAAVSLVVFRERPSVFFAVGAALMAMGAWLHLTERHEHEHEREPSSTVTRMYTTSITSMSTSQVTRLSATPRRTHIRIDTRRSFTRTPITPTFTTGTDTIEMRFCELCLRRALRSRSRSGSVLPCLTRRAPLEQ